MLPYNYRSYYPGRTEIHNIGWAKIPQNNPFAVSHETDVKIPQNNPFAVSHESDIASAPGIEHKPPRQIQVNSTIDADIGKSFVDAIPL